jgi:hypothetical protein
VGSGKTSKNFAKTLLLPEKFIIFIHIMALGKKMLLGNAELLVEALPRIYYTIAI